MNTNSRQRAKMVRALAKVLTNEKARLRKYYWLGKALGVLGGFTCGLALFAALRLSDAIASWLVVTSAIGGLFAGLAIYFGNSVRQWPVLRPFINEQAVQEAARNETL
jgi:sulfite exporter TauE/SafE